MPSKSRDQQKLIFAKRGQYKTKENTPDDWKWVWDKDWEEVKEMKRYKRYFKESSTDFYSYEKGMTNKAMNDEVYKLKKK